jgi:hypothetical protein
VKGEDTTEGNNSEVEEKNPMMKQLKKRIWQS